MSTKEFVDAGDGIVSVVAICKRLGVSRSNCYCQQTKTPSARERRDRGVAVEKKAVFAKSKNWYGSLMRALRKRGVRVGDGGELLFNAGV